MISTNFFVRKMYVQNRNKGNKTKRPKVKSQNQKSIKSKLIFTGNSNTVSVKLAVARESEFSKKDHYFSQFAISLPQANKQDETYIANLLKKTNSKPAVPLMSFLGAYYQEIRL